MYHLVCIVRIKEALLPVVVPFLFQRRHVVLNNSRLHSLFASLGHLRIRRTPINLYYYQPCSIKS